MKSSQNTSLPVIIEIDEDGVFIVSCPLFKGCHSYGDSIDEAIENLSEVIEICMDEETETSKSLQNYVGIKEINIAEIKKIKLQNA
jgi:predicted RNase H-like HicB family nuclease